ncbi:MAG: uroporphyrinogen-III synthase [Parvularculaceae bacterium]
MKVINTRPAPDAGAFSAAIRAAGGEVILSPVMTIRFRGEPAPVAPGEALAFTSANGVRAFAQVNADRSSPVFAVGAATADEARRAGFQDVAAAEGEVESLARLIAGTKGPWSVLHLAGSDRAGDLVAALAERGVPARRQVLYEAVPAPHLSPEARAALANEPENCAVGLFSPRSAVLFFAQTVADGLESRLSRATLLALSPAVAAAALQPRWGAVKIAAVRSADAMAALIDAAPPTPSSRRD